MSDAIKDIVQRIRADRAKRQDTRIAFNESHIVLNFLEKMQRLESENAELRARMDKAVELPCKVGDTVYQYDNAGRIYVSKIKNIVYETNGIAFDKRAINNSIFLTRAEAESRLAELKGEQQ